MRRNDALTAAPARVRSHERERVERRPRSWLKLGAVALAALFLSGCVYLRLLQLKRQIAAFDEHFVFHSESGLRLECLHPVLLADDLRFLGFYPATVRKVGVAEQWHIRWLKQRAAGATEKVRYEISFDLTFSADKLTALHIPENYFAFMPKEVVIAGVKSLGGAQVDKAQRSILAQLRDKVIPPSAKGVAEMLGPPTDQKIEGDRETFHYHFVSDDPGAKGKDFDLRLVFDAQSGDLRETIGRLPVGNLHLKFDPPPARAPNSGP
jgi:hypothetical protein